MSERVEEIRARRARHADVLDTGGTELALIGDDIDWLLAQLADAERARDEWRHLAHEAQTLAMKKDADLINLDGDRAGRILGLRTELTAATQREGALRASLINLLNRHVSLVSSGDCGSWDVETESAVMDARAALLTPPSGYTLRDAIAAQEGDDED